MLYVVLNKQIWETKQICPKDYINKANQQLNVTSNYKKLLMIE